ncbi:MAG TPA: homocysteine S-methyltransferase family protein, partial [Solirubrobacteraceae bacterium]
MDPFDSHVTTAGRSAALPQLQDRLFITDSGLETTLIYRHHLDLPEFAAFVLLETNAGRQRLRAYFDGHAAIARVHGAGFIAESPTWRANRDWGRTLGYDSERLAMINRVAIMQLAELRARAGQDPETYIISGCIGPRHDGHDASIRMGAAEAERYHDAQIQTFADTPVDLVSALTITYVDEAIGITRAAGRAGLPVVISFTVETDGRLPSGMSVEDAILQVDAATDRGPAYYMINCAHPTHFSAALQAGRRWPLRIRGIRANASRRSHAELDAATTLDDGDPVELAVEYRRLIMALPQLTILGGCCGTDHRHVAAIADVCADLFEPIRAARS